ncbi:MAG: hypothetical protein KGN84_03585 [Acidobacteriota bacterium]|nr:hypothetical protein [Acidobacteriota bacterium]
MALSRGVTRLWGISVLAITHEREHRLVDGHPCRRFRRDAGIDVPSPHEQNKLVRKEPLE